MNEKLNSIGILEKSIFFPKAQDHVAGGVAVQYDLVKALLRYLDANIDFIGMKDLYNQVSITHMCRKYKNCINSNRSIHMINKIDILQKNKKVNCDILHDTERNFMELILFRNYYTENYPPITYNMHVASGAHFSYSVYLMKLFSDFQKYDSLICGSKAMKEVVINYLEGLSESFNTNFNANIKFNGQINVIPFGVDTHEFMPKNKYECRKKCNLPENAFIILYHGRISSYYKCDLLPIIKVFNKILRKNKDINPLLVISGIDDDKIPFYPAIEDYIAKFKIQDNVILLKDNNYFNRSCLISSADIFTSIVDNPQETFGITPIEAMACGIPQVVSDWDGYKETVVEGITGFRIPTYWCDCDEDFRMFPFCETVEFKNISFYDHFLMSQSIVIDQDAYENALQNLIDNPEKLKEMSINSINIANEKYAWDKVIPLYQDLWTNLHHQKLESEFPKFESKLTFLNNRYCDVFSKYPTRCINFDEKFIITEDGKNLIKGSEPYPLHYQYERIFNEGPLAINILKLTENSCFTINEMIKRYGMEYNTGVIKRSIMWMFKHGFIKMY